MPTSGPTNAGARFAVVVTAIFLAGQLGGWPLPYLSCVFAGMFALAPRPLPIAVMLRLLATITLIVAAGCASAILLAPYPFVLLVVLALVLVRIFKLAAGGGSLLVVLFALLASLLLPILALRSPNAAVDIAWSLVLNTAVALFVSGLGFLLIPPASAPASPEAKASAADPDAHALRTTLVVYPLVLAFLAFGWTSALILIMVAMIAQQQSSAAGLKAGSGLLAANLLGGVVAYLAYEVLVAAPSIVLMVVLVALVTSSAGALMARRNALAPLAPSAANAFIILLGGALAPFGDDVDVKLEARLVQLAMAVSYAVVAFRLLEVWRRPDRPVEPQAQ